MDVPEMTHETKHMTARHRNMKPVFGTFAVQKPLCEIVL